MKQTKEIENKILKSHKGVTMVSLLITIILMFVVSSITIYTSLDRFEVNRFNKMKNDINLLEDKILSYYLEYNALPILRDDTGMEIEYPNDELEFNKNPNDNDKYYIIDLEAMEAISLNYGKEGFESIKQSKIVDEGDIDIYIINEKSHQIYYIKGIELNGNLYNTVYKDDKSISDEIPPSKPEINIISGTVDDKGTYITDVKIEIIPGKDNWSGVDKTTYSINDGTETEITDDVINNITEDGTYTIKAKTHDKNGNISEYTTETITIKKAEIILDKTNLSIVLGTTEVAELTATLENVNKDFIWKASENSGLIISGEGNTKTITATKTVENATISVSYGKLTASCNIIVTQ